MGEGELEQLIRQVRAAFQDLKTCADRLHEDMGVNASMRAVLEHLGNGKATTVPQIARDKNVSRQHIQIIVDTLREGGLIRLRDNPAHKRSPLVVMTARGTKTYRDIRAKEQAVFFRPIAKKMNTRDVAAATKVIAQLRQHISTMQED